VLTPLAGDGPDRPRSRAPCGASWKLSANVTILGYQSQTQCSNLLAETDVFCRASFAEGVPVVLMEAMAAAVPVWRRQRGNPELVEDASAAASCRPPRNAESLAARNRRPPATPPNLRNRFGAVAVRAKVEREFRWSMPNRPSSSRRIHSDQPLHPGLDESSRPRITIPSRLHSFRRAARYPSRIPRSPGRDEPKVTRSGRLDSIARNTIAPAFGSPTTAQRRHPRHPLRYGPKLPYLKVNIRRDDRGFRKLGGGVISLFQPTANDTSSPRHSTTSQVDDPRPRPAAELLRIPHGRPHEADPRLAPAAAALLPRRLGEVWSS